MIIDSGMMVDKGARCSCRAVGRHARLPDRHAPLVPAPTVRLIEPPVPPVAEPEPIEIEPDVPHDDVPELSISMPLAPAAPASAVLILTTQADETRRAPSCVVQVGSFATQHLWAG